MQDESVPRADADADDTDDWLQALAGRPRNGAAPGVNTEAALLREALRRWPAVTPALSADDKQAQLAALLARARADPRLAARPGCAACDVLRRWLAWPRLAGPLALAAVAALAVFALPWQALRPTSGVDAEPAGTLRGSSVEGVQRLRAADPRALRDRIADDLAAAGVTATRYERQGRFGLDADLPAPLPDTLLRLLRSNGLAAPASGGLAVEVDGTP